MVILFDLALFVHVIFEKLQGKAIPGWTAIMVAVLFMGVFNSYVWVFWAFIYIIFMNRSETGPTILLNLPMGFHQMLMAGKRGSTLRCILKRRFMKNSYSSLKCRLFYRCLINRKITFKKLLNVAQCLWGYFRQSKQASPYPFILSLELGNECNIRCKFCRDEKGVIHDYNPQKPATGIPQGKMSVEMACSIIEQVKDHILIAVLYTNGEPLLYHDLPKVIKYATERKVATMIATNGLLLNDRIMTEILEAGIDLIKIQLSGFTQDIYNIETRVGDVEKLKTNIRRMAKMNKAGKHNAVILIDYISYKYNRHHWIWSVNFVMSWI